MNEERKLYKDKDNMFILEINNKAAHLYQRKAYSKQEMKDNYNSVVTQIRVLKDNLIKLKRQASNAVKYTDEEQSIKDVLDKIASNQASDKALVDIDRHNEELHIFETQKKEIEGVIPEVLRSGK